MYLLVEALSDTSVKSHYKGQGAEWFVRECDAAAGAIQYVTGKDFGYSDKASTATKDAAIRKTLSEFPPQK